jgi:hypothetical protein
MLRIARWNELFEDHRTRDVKNLTWLPIKNDLANDSHLALIDHEEGAAHFGAWLAILLVASRVPRPHRGDLRRSDGTPHDARSLAFATRIPIKVFEAVIPRLLDMDLLVDSDKPRRFKSLPSRKGAAATRESAVTPRKGAVAPRLARARHTNTETGTNTRTVTATSSTLRSSVRNPPTRENDDAAARAYIDQVRKRFRERWIVSGGFGQSDEALAKELPVLRGPDRRSRARQRDAALLAPSGAEA